MPPKSVFEDRPSVYITIRQRPKLLFNFFFFHFQKTVPTNLLTFLEDTKDFLKRINDITELPTGTRLLTFDIEGSYSHIPHEEEIENMKEYLNLTKDQFISTNSLCDFARIILTENYFEIRTDIYL